MKVGGHHEESMDTSNATRPLSRCCLRSYFVKEYCTGTQRAQQEIQGQSSNTEEQATSNFVLNTSIARVL